MKKFLCIFLALLVLVPLTAACASSGEGEDTGTSGITGGNQETLPGEETKLQPNLPDVKYDGYEFNVANDFAKATKYTTNAIDAYAVTGDPINDALYHRTMLMEDTFGIKIVDHNVDLAPIRNTIASGEDVYAIATITLSNIMQMVNAGYAIDIYDVDTIDLDMPWWDKNAEEKLSFDGRLYYTFSDFLITGLDNARATYFNKNLITNLGLENPYELVVNGRWTIEKMKEMATAAVDDLNGDGKYTVLNDQVGIANNATTFYEAMLTGCDAEIMKQGQDGIPYFTCYDEKDFFIGVYQKLLELFTADNCYLIAGTDDARTMFIEGRSLFIVDTLYMASKSRVEDINFGILPVAKYTEAQEKYYHVSPNPHGIMIPSTTLNTDRTGVLLEALSYYSSAYYSDTALIPSYYEVALKAKSATDTESADMLTLIHDNISYVIKIVGTDFSNLIFSNFAAGRTEIASILEKQQASMIKRLEDVVSGMK